MVYGLENIFLTKRDVNDLKVLEGKIIKRALALPKFSSTSTIQQALKLGETEEMVKRQKLKFFVRLLDNRATNAIIQAQLTKYNQLPAKSLLIEIMNIINVKERDKVNLDMLKIAAKNKIALIELNQKFFKFAFDFSPHLNIFKNCLNLLHFYY